MVRGVTPLLCFFAMFDYDSQAIDLVSFMKGPKNRNLVGEGRFFT